MNNALGKRTWATEARHFGRLVLNETLGWWWADPIAALVMVPTIAREGPDGVRGRSCCDTCAPGVPSGH